MQSTDEGLNWDFLRFFVTLAECGSLNRAAHILGTSHTTVGRNISLFEQKMGVRLFDRLGNRYFLNSDGRRIIELARDARNAIRTIGELLDLGQPTTRRRLQLATTAFISDILFPSILAGLPDTEFSLSVDAVLGQDFSASIDETYALAISQYRIGRQHWSAQRLGEIDIGFYCTRGYLDTAATTVNERHMRSQRFALWADVQRAQRGSHAGRFRAIAEASTIVSDSLNLILQTGLRGRAIATLPRFLVRDYPDLLPVLQDIEVDGLTVWSHSNQRREQTSDCRLLNDMIAKAIGELHAEPVTEAQSPITMPS